MPKRHTRPGFHGLGRLRPTVKPKTDLELYLTKYGLTPEDYNALYEVQNGLCAICKEPGKRYPIRLTKPPATERNKRLHIDHNHATNKIRGLLCHRCNNMLGFARDNIETLRSAIMYLLVYSQGANRESQPPDGSKKVAEGVYLRKAYRLGPKPKKSLRPPSIDPPSIPKLLGLTKKA